MYRFESSGGPYDRVLYGCCKGVQGPSSGVEFASVCVRRSGDLGVEMQTLPVKLLGTWPCEFGKCHFPKSPFHRSTFKLICHRGKTHDHRPRGDTPWKAQTIHRSMMCNDPLVVSW